MIKKKCIKEHPTARPNPLDAPNNLHASDISVMFPLSPENNPESRQQSNQYHRRPDLRLSFVLLVLRSSDDALPVERKLLLNCQRVEDAINDSVNEIDRVLTFTSIIIIGITATSITALLPPVLPSFEA